MENSELTLELPDVSDMRLISALPQKCFEARNRRTITNRCVGDPPVSPPVDKCGGKYMVDTAGYVPKEEQLRLLTQSGAALESYRRKMYPERVPKDYMDDRDPPLNPTIRKSYDFFDCHRDVRFVKNALTLQEKEAAIMAEREKAKAAQPEPPPTDAGVAN